MYLQIHRLLCHIHSAVESFEWILSWLLYFSHTIFRNGPDCWSWKWLLGGVGCAGSSLLSGLFSSCSNQDHSLVALCNFSLWWHLLLQFRGSRSLGLQKVHWLQSTGSIVLVHGLSYLTACGIFPAQGSNLGLLHWQQRMPAK